LASNTASNWSQLEKMIMAKVNSALEQEVAEMVKGKIQEHVQEDVYNVYPNPSIYERRNLNSGSLGDIEQMDSQLIENGILEVKDNADFNHSFARKHGGYGDINTDKSLAYNIEFGYGLQNAPYNQPRSFIEKTREEIQNNSLHTKTLKSALKTRGLEVL